MTRKLTAALRRAYCAMTDKSSNRVVHTPDAMDRFSAANKPPFDEWIRKFGQGMYQIRNDTLATFARDLRPLRVLEAGAAGPFLAQTLLRECPTIQHYACLNFHPPMADYIRRHLRHQAAEVLEIDIHQMTTERLAHYDLFVSTSLEHFRQDRTILTRLVTGTRVLASISTFDHPEHWRVLRTERDIRWRYDDILELRVTPIGSTDGGKLLMIGKRI